MASPELIQSWARTDGFLREARAALPTEIVEAFSIDLQQFEEFLDHNEFGLAFGCLHGIAAEANYASPDFKRPLSRAAENMGRR